MDQLSLEIWFPSYGINLGLLSQEIRDNLYDLANSLEITIEATYFEDMDKFVIQAVAETQEYFDYFANTVFQQYGEYFEEKEIKLKQTYRGRIVEPGKVGFGMFVDIGIRPNKDTLISLRALRKQCVKGKLISARKIIDAFGFVDGYPIHVEIDEITKKGRTVRYNSIFSESTLAIWNQWLENGTQVLIITKSVFSYIEDLVKKKGVKKFVSDIVQIDPTCIALICKKRTKAEGLIPMLGPYLDSSPIGIFDPKEIKKLLGEED